VLRERPAEGPPRAHPGQREVERRPRDAEAAAGDHHAVGVHRRHDRLEAAPRLAQHMRVRHEAVVEREGREVVAPPAELAEPPRDREPGRAARHDQRGEAPGQPRLRIAHREDEDVVRAVGVRDELLAAAHHPAARGPARAGAQAAEVGAGVGLGQRVGDRRLGAHQRPDQPFALRRVDEAERAGQAAERLRERHAGAPALLGDHRLRDHGEAGPAELRRQVVAVEAERHRLAPESRHHRGVHGIGRVHLRLQRREVAGDEAAHGAAQLVERLRVLHAGILRAASPAAQSAANARARSPFPT
jgi:hypothetical protein